MRVDSLPRRNPSLSMGVSTAPGRTAFTRIPSLENSSAMARVSAKMPPLLAAYEAMSLDVARAWTELMLTIAPLAGLSKG